MLQNISSRRWNTIMAIVVGLAAIVVGLQQYLLGVNYVSEDGTITYTHYNNYVIFKNSFDHLLEGKNLYAWHDLVQDDLYKYSPAFALFFGVFRSLPDSIGLILWDLLNALPLWFAFNALRIGNARSRALIFLIVLVELITSMQNSQSNGLIAALMIGSFLSMERKNFLLAAILIALATYIKIFAIVACCFAIFFQERWRFAVYFVASCIVLTFIPLIATQWNVLMDQYGYWWKLLRMDHGTSIGISVMGWLRTWFGLNPGSAVVLVPGVLLFLAPLVKHKMWKVASYRSAFLASALIWVVIFNHKAESPTFVIAVAGVAIWYLLSQKTIIDKSLLALCLVFTVLIMTDLFPNTFKSSIVEPYVLKGVPCIIIWVMLVWQQLFQKWDAEIVGSDQRTTS